jgi:acyl carrier protein
MQKTTLDKEELRALIADTLDVEVADVTDSAQFVADLEVDSLMALEVMVVLEHRYHVKIDESQLAQISCLESAYGLLKSKLDVP